MVLEVLLLGAMVYIGENAILSLAQMRSNHPIASFIRNSDKGSRVATQYASVRIVYGNLDDGGFLEGRQGSMEAFLVRHMIIYYSQTHDRNCTDMSTPLKPY